MKPKRESTENAENYTQQLKKRCLLASVSRVRAEEQYDPVRDNYDKQMLDANTVKVFSLKGLGAPRIDNC